MKPPRLPHLFAMALLAWPSVAVSQSDFVRLQRYEFGRDRSAWDAMDEKIRNPLQRERDNAERALINLLIARDSSMDAKILACRGLRYVAGRDGINTLLSVIRDQRLSGEACLALQEKMSPDINPTLRDALPIVENALKGQIMVTLGRRQDQKAVAAIGSIARGIQEPGIRESAIRALGQIGGKAALDALSGLSLGPRYKALRQRSLIQAAVKALSGRDTDQTAGLAALRRLAIKAPTPSIRFTAIYEWAKHDPDQRLPLCRQALSSREDALLPIAPKLLGLLEVTDARALYADDFPDLSTAAKILLVELWNPSHRNEDRIRSLSLDASLDENLRAAASRAVDRIQE